MANRSGKGSAAKSCKGGSPVYKPGRSPFALLSLSPSFLFSSLISNFNLNMSVWDPSPSIDLSKHLYSFDGTQDDVFGLFPDELRGRSTSPAVFDNNLDLDIGFLDFIEYPPIETSELRLAPNEKPDEMPAIEPLVGFPSPTTGLCSVDKTAAVKGPEPFKEPTEASANPKTMLDTGSSPSEVTVCNESASQTILNSASAVAKSLHDANTSELETVPMTIASPQDKTIEGNEEHHLDIAESAPGRAPMVGPIEEVETFILSDMPEGNFSLVGRIATPPNPPSSGDPRQVHLTELADLEAENTGSAGSLSSDSVAGNQLVVPQPIATGDFRWTFDEVLQSWGRSFNHSRPRRAGLG